MFKFKNKIQVQSFKRESSLSLKSKFDSRLRALNLNFILELELNSFLKFQKLGAIYLT